MRQEDQTLSHPSESRITGTTTQSPKPGARVMGSMGRTDSRIRERVPERGREGPGVATGVPAALAERPSVPLGSHMLTRTHFSCSTRAPDPLSHSSGLRERRSAHEH